MRKKLIHALLVLTVVLGLGATTSRPAEARRGGVAAGIAVGTLLGLGIAGAYAGPRYYGSGYYGPGCYRGPRQCNWVGTQLLDRPVRRARLQRRRLALLAPDHLRVIAEPSLGRWRLAQA
jgi:hypothetical protein